MTDNEQFIRDRFKSLITSANETGKITDRMFVQLSLLPLETLDEMEQANNEFIHFMTNFDYYDTLERIEKGEKMLEVENDEAMKYRYMRRLHDLYAKLESLSLGGEQNEPQPKDADHQQETGRSEKQRGEAPHEKGAA